MWCGASIAKARSQSICPPITSPAGSLGRPVTFSILPKEQEVQLVYPHQYRRSLPRVWLTSTCSAPIWEYLGLLQREASTRTSFACFGEMERSLRLIASPTRCRETSPLTRLGSDTRIPWDSVVQKKNQPNE